MTQREEVRRGCLTPFITQVAQEENLPLEEVTNLFLSGKIVIPHNPRHPLLRAVGIGSKLRTKVNVNLGTSMDYSDLGTELEKVKVAVEYGADAIMDLSTGGDIREIRRRILEASPLPVGTVPVYQAAIEAIDRRGSIVLMKEDDLFEVIEAQAKEGVDFMTVHCGLTLKGIERLKKQGRVADIVSRGGAFHLAWMVHHGRENPLYAQFDRLLEIARRYDITLSLGDGLRPGAIADATDRPQLEELLTLGELVRQAWERDVQVMVEGPGHIPIDQIEMNVKLEKQLCHEAPFYVLGPLVTDIAPGYDHIVSAIGGAIAAAAGADFLCYVTPAEHLGLPTVEDVREGLIAARIAAHAADLVKGVPGARERDFQMSRARRALDWKKQRDYVIDPHKFDEVRSRRSTNTEACSMCGKYCAMRIVHDFLNSHGKADESCF